MSPGELNTKIHLCDCAILILLHLEIFRLKTLDGTANPYLALSGVLMAGLSGIVGSKELTIKDCSGEASPAVLGEEGRGIKERFPLNWKDAFSKFEESAIADSIKIRREAEEKETIVTYSRCLH